MPSPPVDPHHPAHVERLLHRHGATHLRVRKHGSALVVESGSIDDPVKHFRLRRDTVHLWLLDMANHTGRWERTPFRAYLEELVQIVIDTFPWTIAPRE